jgi:hypothetical protein
MSYCLTLGIIKNEHAGLDVLAFDRLRTDLEGEEIFEPVRREATPLDVPMMWHTDEGLRRYTEDAYGNPLTFVTAYRLTLVWPMADLSAWDRAVLRFLHALPPSTRIVLYWC